MEKKHPYEDILHAARPETLYRPRMSMQERAAQFSPFAALTGYDDTIRETARLTDAETEADDAQLALLDRKFRLLTEHIAERPQVTVTWFQPDDRKTGGSYRTETVRVRKADTALRVLVTDTQRTIPADRITALSGELFAVLESEP